MVEYSDQYSTLFKTFIAILQLLELRYSNNSINTNYSSTRQSLKLIKHTQEATSAGRAETVRNADPQNRTFGCGAVQYRTLTLYASTLTQSGMRSGNTVGLCVYWRARQWSTDSWRLEAAYRVGRSAYHVRRCHTPVAITELSKDRLTMAPAAAHTCQLIQQNRWLAGAPTRIR